MTRQRKVRGGGKGICFPQERKMEERADRKTLTGTERIREDTEEWPVSHSLASVGGPLLSG